MATYIVLSRFTAQGIRDVKDSPRRLAGAKRLAKSLGGRIRSFHMTMGSCDAVAVLELPDDDAAASFALQMGRAGNVTTETLKAFPEADYRRIVNGLPK